MVSVIAIRVNVPEHGIAGISNGSQIETIAQDVSIVIVIWKVKLPPLALPDQMPAIASALVVICVVVSSSISNSQQVDITDIESTHRVRLSGISEQLDLQIP